MNLKAPMHDHEDPVDSFQPIPIWLVSIFGGLMLWGGWYLGTYSGGWDSSVLEENPAVQVTTAPAEEDPLTLGKRLFTANCVVCHQANAQGVAGQYPPLAGSEWVHGHAGWMKRIVLNGLEGAITVKGQRFNNAMPPFSLKLNDRQIAAVISFVRTNEEWGNKVDAVSPESVAATRLVVKTRQNPWSASELQMVSSDDYHEPATKTATTKEATTKPAK